MTDLPEIWPEPWLVREAIVWLKGWLKPTMRVFEWGSGASTIWMARRVDEVLTVDADPKWIAAVERAAFKQDMMYKVDARVIRAEPPDFDEYAGAIDEVTGRFDLIFIDGENGSRLACARRCIGRLARDGAILLDNSGSAEHTDARDFLLPFFGRRLVWVGEVATPIAHKDMTETSIFIQPLAAMTQ